MHFTCDGRILESHWLVLGPRRRGWTRLGPITVSVSVATEDIESMANSANGKRNGRPTGTAKASSTAARPATNSGRTAISDARPGATSLARGTTATGARLAGIRERSGQPTPPRRLTQSRRAQQRPWYLGTGGIFAAIGVILVALVVFLLIAHGGSADQYYTPVSSTVLNEITHVDTTTLAKVGAGSLPQPLVAAPANTPPNKDGSGKPIVLYMGAEYCPYCAGDRWSMIIALSRFGAFSNLHNMVSSDNEADLSSLPTFTFRGSTYTSQYITFQSVEIDDRYSHPLENATTQQNNFFNTYNYPPYVTASAQGGIPFVSFANQYFEHSAGYSVAVLTDSTRDEIASHLNDPTNNVTQSIEANANYITSAICKITNNQPASVCTTDPSSTVKNPIPGLVAKLPAQQ
jgi:hypothetical protein